MSTYKFSDRHIGPRANDITEMLKVVKVCHVEAKMGIITDVKLKTQYLIEYIYPSNIFHKMFLYFQQLKT